MKKFTALLLVFSLMMLSTNLYAKERRGAKLLITTLDGQQIEGELITVKPNSLLLLDTEGKDVSIDIADIKVIKIVKKLGVAWGALVGFLWGAGGAAFVLGVLIGASGKAIVRHGWPVAVAGAIMWAIVGPLINVSKKIRIEGMTDLEIQETMDKLRKKARIRDYR